MSKNVLIAGGTGLIGTRLTELLHEKGYSVAYLSRPGGNQNDKKVKYYPWEPHKGQIPDEAILGADYIVNLAGANLSAHRWTEEFKKEILTSRTDSTATIVDALNQLPHHVDCLVSTSAIGYYGWDNPGPHTEEAPAGTDFVSQVCVAWEGEAKRLKEGRTRLFIPRIGIVLSTKGGALAEMIKPMKFLAGAPLGDGRQMTSWIHIDDMCRIIMWGMENPDKSGTWNGVAPTPVTNKELTVATARAIGKPLFLPPVPRFALKIILGDFVDSVVSSMHVSSKKLEKAGFQFQFPRLHEALDDVVRRGI